MEAVVLSGPRKGGPLCIAPALDPAVTLTAACLGYWLRQNGSTAFLSPGYPDVETRQGAVVQRIFRRARFCVVPVLVANILSPSPRPVKSLDQLARVNTAGCVIASHILHQFRRLLLEHGGMQHAQSSLPLSVPEWLTRPHDNALQAIPTRFLPESVSPARPQRASADNQTHPCCKPPPMKQLLSTPQHFPI